ncbi:GNAT family N-acetyltransferase [Rhodoferax aquaticus]|uniref:GNAT family N-acetyltransferase n=1 Tax=Rhodoferax aquaticus TaxID=2527691 RepID=A0A515EKF0_9BURK|nr:GNAT family N-acetyltransferase [Rhodoferax aquaticus]QDL53079.1 GNAT family N-acetyltransferase [Rhodoferax aquaticus]
MLKTHSELAQHDLVAASVRVARPQDAAALSDLCAEHALYEGIAFAPQDHALRLSHALAAERLQAWLALRGAEVLGYASVTLDFSTLAASPYAHLDCLYLREAARGQGLGRALMAEVKAFAAAHHCRHLQWQTPPWNVHAMGFYESLGATALAKHRFSLAV